jgi:hypothetical protein
MSLVPLGSEILLLDPFDIHAKLATCQSTILVGLSKIDQIGSLCSRTGNYLLSGSESGSAIIAGGRMAAVWRTATVFVSSKLRKDVGEGTGGINVNGIVSSPFHTYIPSG